MLILFLNAPSGEVDVHMFKQSYGLTGKNEVLENIKIVYMFTQIMCTI